MRDRLCRRRRWRRSCIPVPIALLSARLDDDGRVARPRPAPWLYHRRVAAARKWSYRLLSIPEGLVIVTKLGARRPPDKSWQPAISPQDLTDGVHDNLRNLGLDALDIVNYRVMGSGLGPAEGSIAEQVTVLADLRRKGLIRHIGLSNVTAAQVAEAQAITDIVCVQNNYNLAHRHDDALIDDLARQGIAYVPFFPLGGFTPLQSSTLSAVADRLGATPMQVALAWLLHRSPNILLIPGTSSVAHLRENLAAGELTLSPEVLAELDGIAAAAASVK